MSTTITNLTNCQASALAAAALRYDLDVKLTKTTVTFPNDAPMTAYRLREIKKSMRADNYDADTIRDVAGVERKARTKAQGRALPAFSEAMRSVM